MNMLGNLNGWHLLIVLALILLLFGAAKLPALAKSLGQSARVFKGEMKAMKADDVDDQAKDVTTPYDAPETASPPSSRSRAQGDDSSA